MMDCQPELASLVHAPLLGTFLPRPSDLTQLDAHSGDEVRQLGAPPLLAHTLPLEPAAGPVSPARATSGFDSGVIREERFQLPAQPRFMDDDQVVQALAANRTNDSLDVSSLLRHSRRAEYFMDTKLSYLLREVPAEDSVAVA
jgi:hypothetical protein